MILANSSNASRAPNAAKVSSAILSPSTEQLSVAPAGILPGVFHEDLPDLLLNREQRTAIQAIQSLTYLKTLSFVHRHLFFPSWKSQNHERKRDRRLTRYIKSVERVIGKHEYIANDRFCRYMIRNRLDWVRCTATVLFDLSVIQHYRQYVFHNNATSPTAVGAIQEVYEKRLAFLELNAQVWCEEGAQLGADAKEVAKQDLIIILRSFDDFLIAQAKQDVSNLMRVTDRALGSVKQLVLEAHFYQGYKKRFIVDGLSIPRFKWQLRSILSAPTLDEVIAELA